MEEKFQDCTTDQVRGYNQFIYGYNNHVVEGLHPSPEAYMIDPTNSVHNMRPESYKPEVKAVHNYSMQTGEEFSLEFMRDRVNPTPHVALNSNNACGLNYATGSGYLELKGILGLSNIGSESGSDVSMLTIVDKASKELGQGPSSLYEDKANCDSLRSVSLKAPGHDLSKGASYGYPSSGSSDPSVTKMKLLFSFGGRVIPRPSDGKLRYVGGETRIVCLSRNISWNELMCKASKIYDQVSVVKYQLPGEDLDALVSVSCDEDLQNMMEECSSLMSGEGSKRFRIFLFSLSDLDDVNNSLSRSDSDSEAQFVVAVNGMDSGSRKSSGLQCFRIPSAERLSDFDHDGVKNKVEPGLGSLHSFATSAALAGNSQQLLQTNSSLSEVYSNFYNSQGIRNGQANQYPVDPGYNYNHSNVSPDVDNSAPVIQQIPTHRVAQDASQLLTGLQLHAPQMLGQAINTKSDSPILQDHKFEKSSHSKKDYNGQKEVPLSTDNGNSQTLNAKSGSKHCKTEYDVNDHGCDKPPVPPQSVFYSMRLPREQTESLNRLSKSDDSLGTQLLVSQPHSDSIPKASMIHTVNQFQESDAAVQTKPPVSPSYAEVVSNGLQACNQNVGYANRNCSDEVLESVQESMVHTQSNMDSTATDGNDTTIVTKDDTKNMEDKGPKEEESSQSEAKLMAPLKNHDDHKVQPSELSWDEIVGSDITNHNPEGHVQPLAWTESSTFVANRDNSKPEGGGDILIDINDRFPRDFLSDIFSRSMLSDDSSTVNPLHNDGTCLSMNMENHEPKRWSYFQKLAQDGYCENNVSLIDQDHIGFVPSLTTVDGDLREAQRSNHLDSQINYAEDNNLSEMPETEGAGKVVHSLLYCLKWCVNFLELLCHFSRQFTL